MKPVISVNAKNFAPTINFFKKESNWRDILERAAEAVLPEVVDEAKRLAYSHFRSNTGKLGSSIEGSVFVKGDKVFYEVTSDHEAAGIIEFGGYSPFPPWKEIGGELDFLAAKAVFENQPFTEPQPFLRPAATNAMPRLNKQIIAEFNRAKP